MESEALAAVLGLSLSGRLKPTANLVRSWRPSIPRRLIGLDPTTRAIGPAIAARNRPTTLKRLSNRPRRRRRGSKQGSHKNTVAPTLYNMDQVAERLGTSNDGFRFVSRRPFGRMAVARACSRKRQSPIIEALPAPPCSTRSVWTRKLAYRGTHLGERDD